MLRVLAFLRLLLLTGAGAFLPGAAQAQVRRCTAADGSLVYTDRKCNDIGAAEPKDLVDARRSINLTFRTVDGVIAQIDSTTPVLATAAQLCENLVAVHQKYAPKSEPTKATGSK